MCFYPFMIFFECWGPSIPMEKQGMLTDWLYSELNVANFEYSKTDEMRIRSQEPRWCVLSLLALSVYTRPPIIKNLFCFSCILTLTCQVKNPFFWPHLCRFELDNLNRQTPLTCNCLLWLEMPAILTLQNGFLHHNWFFLSNSHSASSAVSIVCWFIFLCLVWFYLFEHEVSNLPSTFNLFMYHLCFNSCIMS